MLRHEDERTTEFRVNGTAAIVIKHVPGKPAQLRHMGVKQAREAWKADEAEGFTPCDIDPQLVNVTDGLLAHYGELSSGRVCRCSVDPHCQEPKLTPAQMAEALKEAGFEKQQGESDNPQDVWERVKQRQTNVTKKVVVWTGTLDGEFILGDRLVKDQVLVTGLTRRGRGQRYSRSKGVGIPFKSLTKAGLLEAMREEWKKL